MVSAGLPNRPFPDPEDEDEPKSPPVEPLEPPNRAEPEPEPELEPNRDEDCGAFSTVEVVGFPNVAELAGCC